MKEDDVYYYIGERLKLEGETENMGVCTKELERHYSRGTHGGAGFAGSAVKCAAVSWSGAGRVGFIIKGKGDDDDDVHFYNGERLKLEGWVLLGGEGRFY